MLLMLHYFLFTVIELTETPEYVQLLSDEMLNGKLYKTAKIEPTSAPAPAPPENNMQLKVSYQTEEDSIETHVMLSNDGCTYTVPQYDDSSRSASSLSSQLSIANTSMAWMKMQKNADFQEFATSWTAQFWIILVRMMRQIARNRQGGSNYSLISEN